MVYLLNYLLPLLNREGSPGHGLSVLGVDQ